MLLLGGNKGSRWGRERDTKLNKRPTETVERSEKSIDHQRCRNFHGSRFVFTLEKLRFFGRHEISEKVKYCVWFCWFFIFVTFWIWQREIKWFRYTHTYMTHLFFFAVICAWIDIRHSIYDDHKTRNICNWNVWVVHWFTIHRGKSRHTLRRKAPKTP